MKKEYSILVVSLLAAASVLPAAATNIETVTVTGRRPTADACLKVATAKYAQWDQARIMIDETRTFADGNKTDTKTVFIPGTVYGQVGNRPWSSMQIAQLQRTAQSPEVLEKAMGFSECSVGDQIVEGGQSATTYDFSYAPEADGSQATGEIIIADSTGLPLRQEFEQKPPPANAAAQVSVRYTYGGDVQVPLAAERADNFRRWRVAQWLRDLQAGRPAW
ncbi:MAG TPA: hypothetical protein VHW02_11880 [Rhizomicrobium sp.]|nr:hypothetical protein [Rhizomicrobium sp.]